jgi:dihydropteroate synthase
MVWFCREHRFDFHVPLVMGIVNVTPDSFSDSGRFQNPRTGIDHALKLVEDGADILDIGGESTRPGATPVPLEIELQRVLLVICEVAKQTKTPISVDTMKPEVARQALDAGASIVNDVSGLADPAMIEVCTKARTGVIVNHMQGTPQTMQANPTYANVVEDVDAFFAERIVTLTAAGIAREAICLDPGIGFGKTFEQTQAQLRNLKVHQRHGLPVCLGVSRKGFLGQITGRPRHERDLASVVVACHAMMNDAVQVLRVHDVAAHRDAIRIITAMKN